jgi:nuclear transport factor 2 (NTF2) superfamily protein
MTTIKNHVSCSTVHQRNCASQSEEGARSLEHQVRQICSPT